MINSSKIILSEISWISNTFAVHFFTICAFEGYGPEKTCRWSPCPSANVPEYETELAIQHLCMTVSHYWVYWRPEASSFPRFAVSTTSWSLPFIAVSGQIPLALTRHSVSLFNKKRSLTSRICEFNKHLSLDWLYPHSYYLFWTLHQGVSSGAHAICLSLRHILKVDKIALGQYDWGRS